MQKNEIQSRLQELPDLRLFLDQHRIPVQQITFFREDHYPSNQLRKITLRIEKDEWEINCDEHYKPESLIQIDHV